MEESTARRLLRAGKLSLVLDLDHTLLHATADPRAKEALRASSLAANDSVLLSPRAPPHHQGIHSFPLPGAMAPMYVKLRPGLGEFLSCVGRLFELHIYTMGSRPYADAIANLIDPSKQLFSGRITSRDDFDEGRQLNQKNLRRIFPCDDSMVLIVDDREDVWLDGSTAYSPNLVRARPYAFFAGLSEAYDRTGAKPKDELTENTRKSKHLTPELLNLIATWSRVDSADRGHLARLATVLEDCHREFYSSFARQSEAASSRQNIPWSCPVSVKDILSNRRMSILKGCHLSFSGVFPRTVEAASTAQWRLAERLGARCHASLSCSVTHLLVDPNRGRETQKTISARSRKDVFIVAPSWLTSSEESWERGNEFDFLIFPEECRNRPVSSEEYRESMLTLRQKRKSDAIEPGSGKRHAYGADMDAAARRAPCGDGGAADRSNDELVAELEMELQE
eukprot:Plantae.Rhodophyta-Rhodochaete_pulchella.ctg3710.p1 GENE.Plantae.Rhodophyta-Rhodochaete_pulchella.ctg3710~~Plantae.Rhodophyta-Rhodochaete_pulchella.ctg3710.p1  ORF type:complete len:523 (+),score=46.58 Plantae.Rhodophyta-Rhodochaete_pulchella.ctg3710:216-1571(+)